MPLPPKVRIKLSSEAAEAISLTPVVVQEFAMRDLLEHILGVTGKDEARIGELLLRGSMVSGASRFRWEGWTADREEIRALLATFPDPEPSRRFISANCERAILRGGRQAIELPRDAVSRKGLFQRESFWDALLRIVGSDPRYESYSYRDRCDRFLRELDHAEAARLREAARAVKYSTLRDQIRANGFTHVELLTRR